MNNNALLRLQVCIQTAWHDLREGEKGQTMVEYAGIAIVVGAILMAIVGVAGGEESQNLGKAIIGKISEAISHVKAGGGE